MVSFDDVWTAWLFPSQLWLLLKILARLKSVFVVTCAAVSSIDHCEGVSEVEVCACCDLCSCEQY